MVQLDRAEDVGARRTRAIGIRPGPLNNPSTASAAATIVTNISAVIRTAAVQTALDKVALGRLTRTTPEINDAIGATYGGDSAHTASSGSTLVVVVSIPCRDRPGDRCLG